MDTHVAGEHGLVVTRLVPATPEAVFAAWTKPDQVKAWWGPYGMTTEEAEIELRPGGRYDTLIRDGEGRDYRSHMTIEDVEAPHRLVLRALDGSCGDLAGTTATLTCKPAGDFTRLVIQWRHPTAAMRETHLAMGFEKGWGETLDRLTAHLCAQPAICPGAMPPAPEHGWLHRLLGDWTYESSCVGPDGQAMQARGVERVRSLGGYWIVGESEGEMPGGSHARWTITMGFDPATRRFRGTFVGSMMPHMFVYDGELDAGTRRLVLLADGPAMDGQGTALYRDTVEMVADDHRTVTSEVQGPDGSWTLFMTGHFHRAA
jgi:uncharacterized protein YndB with AHSA1/START domain